LDEILAVVATEIPMSADYRDVSATVDRRGVQAQPQLAQTDLAALNLIAALRSAFQL
jgi:hypothetical protein